MWPGRRRRHGRGRHGAGRGGFRRWGQGEALTLDRVPRGCRVRVVRVRGGSRLVHRLAALGVVPGALVSVARGRGPAVLSLKGTRIAVGRGAAMAIEVEETAE